MSLSRNRMILWTLIFFLTLSTFPLVAQASVIQEMNEHGSFSAAGLTNGGFENDDEDTGAVAGWQSNGSDGSGGPIQVTAAVYKEGQRSAFIEHHASFTATGIVSDLIAVNPFDNIIASAEVLRVLGSEATMDLRFYNNNEELISIVSGLIQGPIGEWSEVRAAASAPKDGAAVQVAFTIPDQQEGSFYVDDVQLTVNETPDYITSLGPQSTSLTIMKGAYGRDPLGRDVLYTVAQGDPAKFIAMDVHTNELYAEKPLVALDGSFATAAWAITVATDGKVYLGSTPNGTLFQYDPLTDHLRAIGKPASTETVIWVLVPGQDGKVYGGTAYNQILFEYDPVTDQTTTLTSFKGSTREYHLRSLAYDEDRHVLYAGAADVVRLYEYDLTTGASRVLNPPGFAGKTSVYDLMYTGGKLFVRTDPGPEMFVYDPEEETWLVTNNTAYNTRGFSEVSPDGRVFYTYYETVEGGGNQWSLYAYDIETGEYGSLNADVKGPAIGFHYVELEDPDFPGISLVGLSGNSGRAFYYNLQNGNIKTAELPIPPQFVELFSIAKSVDGKMLSSGFISGGGMGIYSPTLNETVHHASLGQIEGYGSLNGLMYFGGYPNASVFVYDPSAEWNRTDPSQPQNPFRIAQLGQQQDRPIALLGVEEENKLYIGSYPIAGTVGGALTIYDPNTNTFDVKRHIVPNHSINSLLYRDGLLYMATSSMEGGSGEIAIYDTAQGKVVSSQAPVPGKRTVTALLWGPDGNIWGMALGTLFIMNPDTGEIVYSDDKFPTADYSHSNPQFMIGTDGHIYGSIYTGYVANRTYTSKLIRIDAETKEVTILLESNVEKLAQDDFGNFYFKYGSELMKYSDPALVVGLTGAQLEVKATRLSRGETTTTALTALLEKGRSTVELSGAEISYHSSKTKVAEIDDYGVIHAKHPGRTEITAAITLDGITVVSNSVSLLVTGSHP
ncbi:hypothetical protein [Paenibacillus senegalensis]|uniref:hypothetical protein n=1 Tax=Paenibacillus senegalensis TaxID=1465766 RepID=UPI00028817EA|nr:hypothetical protein [Paenibacillus senegalensis]